MNRLYFFILVWVNCICVASAQKTAQELYSLQLKWKTNTGAALRGTASLFKNQLLAGNAAGYLVAFDKTSGRQLWRFKADGAIHCKPLIAMGKVFFSCRDNFLYAVDLETHKLRWKTSLGDLLPHKWGWEYFLSSPVIDGKNLLVGGGDGHLYCIEGSTGKISWKFATGGRVRSTPMVSGDTVYVNSFDGYCYAISTSEGKLIWKFGTRGVHFNSDSSGWDRTSIDASPVVSGDLLLFGSRDGYLYAIDRRNGEKRWEFSYGPTWSIASPVVAGGTVYTGWSDNFLFSAHDLQTGKEQWKFQCNYYVYTTPVIKENVVCFGSHDGNVYLIDRKTGKKTDQYRTDGGVLSSPLLEGDVLYSGSDDGYVYAFRLSEEKPFKRAVFSPLDPFYQRWLIDPRITPYLALSGFEVLDTAGLASFIKSRIDDGIESSIVFAVGRIPASVIGEDPSRGLLRQYLQKGGRVVWIGNIPNYERLDSAGRFLSEDATVAERLLDISFDNGHDAGWYYSKATAGGIQWKLPSWSVTSFSVSQQRGILPLAINEYGRASSWVRAFSSKKGSGFFQVRTWEAAKRMKDSDLLLIKEIAGTSYQPGHKPSTK